MKVMGYRLLVQADEVETVTEGGIVVVMDENKAKIAQMYGTVVSIGDQCWKGKGWDGEPWCKVGDRIAWSKFAGKFVLDPDTEEEFVILNDEDVLVVL
jgi:co-chaperonin GroES (HSP10)